MDDKKLQDEQVLSWLLGQIYRAEKRKEVLDRRLARINAEREAPVGGVGYDPMPRSSGSGDGAASILLRISEIEDRIYQQKTEIDKAITRVMDILDYLPASSMEREVMELRYIDLMSWEQIADEIPMSRSQCHVYKKKGMEILLQNARVQKLVDENRTAYLEYMFRQEDRRIKTKVGDQLPDPTSKN